MAKIRAVHCVTGALIVVGIGVNVWLFMENIANRRALAYACGFTNGQRNIMDAAPHIFKTNGLAELRACGPERENAQRHGFKAKDTP